MPLLTMTSLSSFSQQHSWFKALIVGVIFVLTEFFGSIFLGGISVRNIVLVLLTIYLCLNHSSILTDFKSAKYLIIYYAFVAFLGLFNGLYENEGLSLVVGRFLPTIILILFLMNYIKTEKELKSTVYVLLLIFSLDAIATILQGVKNPLGWRIAAFFQTAESLEESQNLFDAHNLDSTVGLSIASGFCGSVVYNGYVLGSMALLVFLPAYWKFNAKSVVLSTAMFLLFSMALFYNQQRMAFYVFHAAVATIIISYAYLRKNYILLLFVLFVGVFLFFNIDFSNWNDEELGRLANFDDEIRTKGRQIFWENFFPDNFLMGNRSKFIELYGRTPHYLPIETLLLGGIIGLTFFSIFVFSIGYNIYQTINKRNVRGFLFSTPIIALLLISLRHSSGFHTGLTLGAYILSLFFLSLSIKKQQ